MAAEEQRIKASDAVYREGIYRTLAGIMAAILLSVLGSWFAFGRDAVSSSEVRNLIAINSPYALDRAGIQSRLDALTEENARTRAEIDKLLVLDSQDQQIIARNSERLTQLERRVQVLENLELHSK